MSLVNIFTNRFAKKNTTIPQNEAHNFENGFSFGDKCVWYMAGQLSVFGTYVSGDENVSTINVAGFNFTIYTFELFKN